MTLELAEAPVSIFPSAKIAISKTGIPAEPSLHINASVLVISPAFPDERKFVDSLFLHIAVTTSWFLKEDALASKLALTLSFDQTFVTS